MSIFRTVAPVSALSVVLLIAGCGNSGSSSTAAPVATSTGAVSGTTWANSVCEASSGLKQTVQDAGQALKFDPNASASVRDQVRTEVGDAVTAVQASAAVLVTTLTTVPAGTEANLAATQQQLQSASDQAQEAVTRLKEGAHELADASSARALITDLTTMKTVVTSTIQNVQTYLDTLRSTATGGTQPVQDMFAAAPACKELT